MVFNKCKYSNTDVAFKTHAEKLLSSDISIILFTHRHFQCPHLKK